MQYPTNMVGRIGEYVLNFRGGDGSFATVVFDANGVAKNTQSASGTVSIDIEGDYYFGTNPGSVQLLGVDIRPAIVRFEIQPLPDGSTPTVALGGRSSAGESPIGVIFRDVAGPEGQFVYRDITPGTNENNTTHLGLPQGRYELIYIMEPADLDGVPILPAGYYGDYPMPEKGSLHKKL